MKKQLFALAVLPLLLIGCTKLNTQKEVTFAEFLYATNGEETIPVPKTGKVTQVIKVKTTNYEKLGKEPEDYTIKYVYNLTFNPDGSFTSEPEYTVYYAPFSMSSEVARAYQGDAYIYTYYLNPLRVIFQKTIYADGVTPHEMRTFRYDYTFGKNFWITKAIVTENLKYSDPVTMVVAESVSIQTLTYSYNF